VLLHDGQESDDDLGAGSDEDLALATLLGVDNVVEAVGLSEKSLVSLGFLQAVAAGTATHENAVREKAKDKGRGGRARAQSVRSERGLENREEIDATRHAWLIVRDSRKEVKRRRRTQSGEVARGHICRNSTRVPKGFGRKSGAVTGRVGDGEGERGPASERWTRVSRRVGEDRTWAARVCSQPKSRRDGCHLGGSRRG
jgi:hypothetical protein